MPRNSFQACNRSQTLRIVDRPFSAILALLVLVAVPSMSGSAYAQSTTATLSGVVEDENGDVVSGVNIALINMAQGTQRLATSNAEGSFVFVLLPPGTYSLTATRDGFAPVEMKNLVLNVNDQVVIKVPLKVGPVSETVQIDYNSTLANESPAVATVVDQTFVSNLPMNGRTFQSLIALAPGVVLTKSTLGSEGQFSVNGQRPNANYFTTDGVSANASVSSNNVLGQAAGSLPGLTAFGSTNNLVSVDALQEFKIQTSTYAAEFGRTPGAQIQILTRSGTNDFHGTAFEYFRNEALDANDWFNNARGLRKPPLRQNDFGGVLGGPIVKDRTFFFFSYEGLRLRLPQSASIQVPSLSARQAAPASLQPFLNAYPVPTGPENPVNRRAPFVASYSDPSTLDSTSIRIDHTFKKLQLFGRFNHAPSNSHRRVNILSQNANIISKTQFVTVGLTHNISNRFLNEIRGNYTRSEAGERHELDDFGGATPPDSSAIFPAVADPEKSLLIFQVSGLPTMIVGRTIVNTQRQTNIIDNLAAVAGDHTLKFGVDYRHLSPITGPQEYNLFVNFGTGLIGTRGVLSGVATSVRVGAQDSVNFVYHNFSAYGQDTWRATTRVTFTYGLRWEVNTPPRGTNGQDFFTFLGLDNPATLSLAPQGTPLWKTTYNNFAPRLGLAYKLSDKQGRDTVLRGGFGIFYDLGEGTSAQAALNFPYLRNRTMNAASGFPTGVPFPLTTTLAQPPAFTLNPPFGSVNVFDPNLKLPRTYQWNLAVEHPLGANTVSASYVGAAGRDLLRLELLQATNANFRVVSVTKNTASSDYNALQLQFQRRLSKRFQALASYTWAKSLDTVSTDIGQDPPDQNINLDQERGPSDFDIRHAFNGAVTYNVPTPSLGTVGRSILRDWSIDAIMTLRSAAPVNVTYIAFPSFGPIAGASLRPDLLTGVPLYISDPTVGGGKRINPAAFTIPTTERQGTLGRNALRGFPLSQLDFALRRQFNFTERINVQLRAEFFNIFNHPNFGDPNPNPAENTSVLGFVLGGQLIPLTPFFGQSTSMLGRSLAGGGTSGGLNPLFQVGGPRSIQFGLKLNF